jgi:hypothetical protein
MGEQYKFIECSLIILFTKLVYYQTVILNKMGEQYKIIEYSLIILFIVTGGIAKIYLFIFLLELVHCTSKSVFDADFS